MVDGLAKVPLVLEIYLPITLDDTSLSLLLGGHAERQDRALPEEMADYQRFCVICLRYNIDTKVPKIRN